MTPSQLKAEYQKWNPAGRFFDPGTMRLFGDTMKNYGVIDHGSVYELYRKKPVKYGLQQSAFFRKDDFQVVRNYIADAGILTANRCKQEEDEK